MPIKKGENFNNFLKKELSKKKKNIENIDDMPIKSGANFNDLLEKELSKEKKNIENIDDMPIKSGGNFNDLLEKELSKQNNFENNKNDELPLKGSNDYFNALLEKELSKDINNNNIDLDKKVEPKFKYVPKKKKDLVSNPVNTKKYKYYSDNFKPKTKKKEANKEQTLNNKNINDNLVLSEEQNNIK